MEPRSIATTPPRLGAARRAAAAFDPLELARLLGTLLLIGLWALAGTPVGAAQRTASGWTEAWRVETADDVALRPVVTPERVYAVGGSTLFAIDATDGRVVWTKGTGEGFGLGPTLAGDALFVANQDGTLLALGAEDGEQRWRASDVGRPSGPPLVVDGSVYLNALDEEGGDRGVLLALDAATGAERWRADLGGGTSFAPVAVRGVVVGNGADPETAAAVVVAFDAETGRELWRSLPEDRLQVRGAGPRQIYAVSQTEGDLVALDPRGRERWRFDPGDPLVWTLDGPAEADGVVYGATGVGQGGPPSADPQAPGVFALDARTGELRWKTEVGGPVGAVHGPVVAGDALAVLAGGPPAPVLLDRETGQTLGQAPVPADASARVLGATADLLAVGYDGAEADPNGVVAAFRLDPTTGPGPGATRVPARTPAATPAATPSRTPTATPAPDSASLTVRAFACPVAYDGDDFAAACTEPLADIGFRLVIPATEFSREATTDASGTAAFRRLGENTYALTGGVPAEFAVQTVICANEDGPIPTEPTYSEIPGGTFDLAAGAAITCSWYVIPEDLRGDQAATAAVTVHLCQAPPADPYAECQFGDASGVVIDGPVRLTTDATSAVPVSIHGVSWVWGEEGGLPFGTYYLQPGGIAVPPGYELSDVRGSFGASGNGWAFTLDETNLNAILAVVYVATAPSPGDVDGDADGLPDTQEAEVGTDPVNPDTDADGLFDGAEVAAGGPGTDPTAYDTDGDGFGDNQEVVEGTDPLDPASAPSGPSGIDSDGDLLSDAQEAELGTDPAIPDTDGDGLTDFAEVGFEPGSATGTDPLAFDTDGDGVGDGAEVAGGTDPTDPASV